MAREFSAHQQRIIRSYYRNRDSIEAQRLSELVTELWLAQDAPRKAQRLWERVRKILERVPDLDKATVDALIADEDVETLAAIAEARFLAD